MSLAFLMLLASPGWPAARAEAAPPAPAPGAAVFFQNDNISDVRLSPNGRYVAIRAAPKGGKRRLVVFKVDKLTEATPVAAYSNADVGIFSWINDARLMYTLTNIEQRNAEARPGLYAVDRDGKRRTSLSGVAERRRSFFGEAAFGDGAAASARSGMHGFTRQRDDRLLVIRYDDNARARLDSLDSVRGTLLHTDAPVRSFNWLVDADGTVRVAVADDGEREAVFFKDPANGNWRKLASFEPDGADAFVPLLYAEGKLYVRARNGKDTIGVYRYDLAANRIEPTALVLAPGFDAIGAFITSEGKMLGYRFTTDAEVVVWFDPHMKAVQEMADAMLPATVNRIAPADHPETPYVLITSISDVAPDSFFLLDTETKKLTALGSANPDIDPARMSATDLVRYKARDGLQVPAYLTLPKNSNKKNLALVVLAQDLPWERGAGWYFDPAVQFLASRGYAVLQPMARGTAGFGARYFDAGRKQWGLAMQADIADGARWAIAQGYADPARVCIAGTGYGGYAALMGLVNDPDLFKCGIDRSGITDIGLMHASGWTDFSEHWKRSGMAALAGDPVADAAQLKATSPLAQAGRITRPLLMAYGSEDERVPFKHGTKLRDALVEHKRTVEWIAYDTDTERPLRPYQENRIDFWTRAEKFLERHIGAPGAATPTPP